MSTLTTVHTPDPTCFAASNLWQSNAGCTQYLPPFATRPADYLTGYHECAANVLGPPMTYSATDTSCYQFDPKYPVQTVFSDCPSGMSVVNVNTWEENGYTNLQTQCCPTAYGFTILPYGPPTAPFPKVINGKTYDFAMSTGGRCLATSVEALAGQQVTRTVATAPALETTVGEWDVEHDFILATEAVIYKHVYVADDSTSTCFGYNCPAYTNPLKSYTRHSGPYVTPTTPPLTQFSPPSTCSVGPDNLWLASISCYVETPGYPFDAPWLTCNVPKAGEPNAENPACYNQRGFTVGSDSTTSYFSACPVGYTTVTSYTYTPYWAYGGTYDVTGTGYNCCPDGSNLGATFVSGDYSNIQTTHAGRSYKIFRYPVPYCAASRVQSLKDKDVTFGLFVDTRIWDKRDMSPATVTTVLPWDVERDILFAEPAGYSHVVFHGTHTCYENCDKYFTYSYYNTDPNAPPPTSATSTSSEPVLPSEPPHPGGSSADHSFPTGTGTGPHPSGTGGPCGGCPGGPGGPGGGPVGAHSSSQGGNTFPGPTSSITTVPSAGPTAGAFSMLQSGARQSALLSSALVVGLVGLALW